MYQRVLSRSPAKTEMTILNAKLQSALSHFRNAKADAEQLLEIGQLEKRGGANPEELAAYMIVASMIYNLDEAMTHE